MKLKKRNKVSADFSMASMADMIFLLLIFFMLTSSIVIPNALNLKLPSSSGAATSVSDVNRIKILESGAIRYNNRQINMTSLNNRLQKLSAVRGGKASVIISPDGEAPTYSVIRVMDAARMHNINAILDTPEK